MLPDYSTFPETAIDGDTFSYRDTTYHYDQVRDIWIADGIVDYDPTVHVYHYRSPSSGMVGTRILSYTVR